jgi:hypothetical protein
MTFRTEQVVTEATESTVVATTANCEVVLVAMGFYARCTARNCTWVSEEITASKHIARKWAEDHDSDC